jgi:N-acetylglutamate synthase-like GNAT family acetyltransferase
MHLRSAKTEDATAACAVLRRSITELCRADHGGDEILLGKWLSNKTIENVTRWIMQSYFVVAEEGETILGVAAMDASGKITLNYVSPEARFRGVSKALVLQLEAQARALGLSECTLETTQTALRFYQSLGYVKSEETYPLLLTGSPAPVLRKIFESPQGSLDPNSGAAPSPSAQPP